MKVKLPIIGPVRTGKDAVRTRTVTKTVEVIKDAVATLGAGFLDLSDRSLTSKTTVSSRLLDSFHGWVYANVSVLAEEISKLEFELYKITYVKGDPVWTEVSTSPLMDLLDKPNPFTTTSQLLYQIEAHLELAGDTFLLLDKPTNPTSIFILPPDKVTVVPGGAADEYQIIRYDYKDQVDGKSIEKSYDPDLIIQIKNPNPSNPWRGKSVVEASATTIDSNVLSEEFLKRFFLNNATPGMTLTSDQRLSKDDITRITADLKKNFGGATKAFKTLLLGGGLKPVAIQHSNKEMEFIELENALRDKIMAMFKNTKASLGIVEDVNRANAEATLQGWKTNVIKPKMNRIVDTLNEFLVPRFGSSLVLTFCSPVPEDNSNDIDEVVKLFSTATNPMMTVNEAREKVGLDPIPGGQFDTIAERTAPVAPPDVPKSLRNIDLTKHMRRNGIYEDIAIYKNIRKAAKDLAKSLIQKQVKPKTKAEARKYSYLSNDQALEYWSKQIKLTEMVEKKFKDYLERFIANLEKKAISSLHDHIPKKYKTGKSYKLKAVSPFDEESEINTGIDLLGPLVNEIAELSGNEAYQMMKLNAIYSPSRDLKKIISDRVELFTRSFVSTDKEKLSNLITAGLEQGQSIPQIESAIRENFSEYRKSQSQTIARTEILNASNSGSLDAFKESGVVEGKQWLTAEDGKVDEDCAQYDGKIVSLDSSFYSSDSEFAEGDPPLHPNCRCVILPVLANEKKADPEKEKLVEELNTEKAKSSAQESKIKELKTENDELTKLLNE